mmetsp:Transcript_40660/g.73057  ORF Transcript_40660/g.73057 Transcript_40660/m.73057 type:complete len:259 (+) Transcript_40660:194-970(+)
MPYPQQQPPSPLLPSTSVATKMTRAPYQYTSTHRHSRSRHAEHHGGDLHHEARTSERALAMRSFPTVSSKNACVRRLAFFGPNRSANHSRGRSLPAALSARILSSAGQKSSAPSKKTPVWSLTYFQPPAMWRFIIKGTLRSSASAATRGEASLRLGMKKNSDCSITLVSSVCPSIFEISIRPSFTNGIICAMLVLFSSTTFPTKKMGSSCLARAILTHSCVSVQLRFQSFHSPPRLECENKYFLGRPLGLESTCSGSM